MATPVSHIEQVLRALAQHKNVILIGPPATGKSRLMSEAKLKFSGIAASIYDNKGPAPFPEGANKIEPWMPSPDKKKRNVLEITFHQGTKHRHFVSGIIPKLAAGGAGFEVSEGVLLEANRRASAADGAALLCIDEINRGPAVSIFGDTLTAIEPDKRLDVQNRPMAASVAFYAHTGDGKFGAHYLSPHVYILASMNEADTSVEPLDVAFLRRFHVYRLEPEEDIARNYLGITGTSAPPDDPQNAQHVYAALVQAWSAVNERIALGRSPAFRIGHGVLMWDKPPDTLAGALSYAQTCWNRIESHVNEVFFGNDNARGVVYAAADTKSFRVREEYFGDHPVSHLYKEAPSLYKLLLDVGRSSP